MSIVASIISLMALIANFSIFEKANEKWWKALIPIYGEYVMYKISNCSKLFIRSIIASVIWVVPVITMSDYFDNEIVIGIMSLIALAAIIYTIVIMVKLNLALAKAFGKGTGFGIGLILLNPIFKIILAFSDARYQYGGETEVHNEVHNIDYPYVSEIPDSGPIHDRGIITEPAACEPIMNQGNFTGYGNMPSPSSGGLFVPFGVPSVHTTSQQGLILRGTRGSVAGRSYGVSDFVRIGRSTEADILISESVVSRAHCVITRNNCGYFIITGSSTNGTWLSGMGKLKPMVPVQLCTGDEIILANEVGFTVQLLPVAGMTR